MRFCLFRLVCLLLLVAGGAAFATESQESDQLPNFIVILVDDMGWSDPQVYGNQWYETPHIDQLAREGVRFTDAYACAPNCSPTRASLLTGLYTPRHGVMHDISRDPQQGMSLLPPENARQLRPEFVTIPELLGDKGYVSASIGKWHLGNGIFGPLSQGFHENLAGFYRGQPFSYFSPYHIPTLQDGPAGEYLTERLTNEALAFLENHKTQPFFLYLSHYAPHIPLEAQKNLIEKYALKAGYPPAFHPVYAAMLESLDTGIGALVSKLEQLELSEKTWIIFFSDNGGYRNATSNLPLRESKGTLYEGGIRTPLIIRGPKLKNPGSVSSEPVICVDILPTITDLAKVSVVPEIPLDGRSLAPLLLNGSALKERALFWHLPYYSKKGGQPVSAIRLGDKKLLEFWEDESLELYDLSLDLSESHNIAPESPRITKQLQEVLNRWLRDIEAPMAVKNPMHPNENQEKKAY